MRLDFDSFFSMNQNRIHYQIHRLNIPQALHEEFYSEGVVALWQAYQDYDQEKGEIGTFINYRIRYRLIDLLRRRSRRDQQEEDIVELGKKELTDGNWQRQSTLPLFDPHLDYLDIPSLYHKPFWQYVKSQLTEKQWKWVKYFIIAELSIKEIMEIENVTADTVKSWGKAVRQKLRKPSVKEKLYELYKN